MLAKIKQNLQFTDRFSTEPDVKPEVKDACGDMISEPIDAVYTWVNGSDPDFIQEFQRALGKCSTQNIL